MGGVLHSVRDDGHQNSIAYLHIAVLGVVLLNTQYSFNFLQSVVYGITGGIGFLVAICLFASVREKLEFADYPECFEGFPICLVSAGLLALAFMGFSGMKIGG